MNEGISIRLEPGFDPRPQWFKDLEQAITDAKAVGWNLATQIILEGEPYIFDGKPETATWSLCPCEFDEEGAGHFATGCPYGRTQP